MQIVMKVKIANAHSETSYEKAIYIVAKSENNFRK